MWKRLTHIAIVMVGTSVADECTFSIMDFVIVQRPSLTTHQELDVRDAEQTLFMATFTLDQPRKEWVGTCAEVGAMSVCEQLAMYAVKDFLSLLHCLGATSTLRFVEINTCGRPASSTCFNPSNCPPTPASRRLAASPPPKQWLVLYPGPPVPRAMKLCVYKELLGKRPNSCCCSPAHPAPPH